MREELKTQLSGAGGALATALAVGALQTNRLGSAPFCYQVAAAIIVVCWLPFLVRIQIFERIPKHVAVSFALTWTALAGGPVLFALLVDLFTGHRAAGAEWYDAVWRIYAILILWIGFAMLNERYIRPWWRVFSGPRMAAMRKNSIAGQAHEIASKKRVAKLEMLKGRVAIVLRKKKLAEKTIELKKKEMDNGKENIKKAADMLDKAKYKVNTCNNEELEDAQEVIDTMQTMLEGACSHEENLKTDVLTLKVEVQGLQLQIEGLQIEWTEALHISNYTTFYR